MMHLVRSLILLTFIVSQAAWCLSPQTKSDDHRNRIVARALNAQSRLTVLSLSLQPGFEDVSALAYLRFGRGAKIVNAFVTNGESGDNEMMPQSPGEVAFQRRSEAAAVTDALQGIEYFLNFPDFGSSSDTAGVALFWQKDSLEARLVNLVEAIRPDLILLAPDRLEHRWESPRLTYLRAALLSAVRIAGSRKTASGFIRPSAWQVKRVVSASPTATLRFPLKEKPEFQAQSFESIGPEIAVAYKSLGSLIDGWRTTTLAYDVDYPARLKVTKTPDAGLPGAVPPSLKNIDRRIGTLWTTIAGNARKKGNIDRYRIATLKSLVEAMDSIDVRLGGWNFFANEERKILLHWKEGLEELRNALYGVSVHYVMKDTVLLARQLTTLRVDSVEGLPGDGITEIFFPDVGREWMLNEELQPKLPLTLGAEYRLISPSRVEDDLPASYGGMMKNRHGNAFEFFILHQKKSRTGSFFKKTTQRILYAPKLTVEPLTPIVRVIPGERVVYKITNHSNDGIRDGLGIHDTIATAEPRMFRLNVKEGSVIDTLQIRWNDSLAEGTYRVPLQIGSAVLGYFGARKFDVKIDSGRTVGVVASHAGSIIVQSLRRLGVRFRILSEILRSQEDVKDIDVLVLDERVLSMNPQTIDSHFSFEEYMQQGGTLLVLSQDADIWNEKLLLGTLETTSTLDPRTPVVADSMDVLMREPNVIQEPDWEGWLFSRALNRGVIRSQGAVIQVAMGDKDRSPAIVVRSLGKGKGIYVNLNLGKQLENIHPGAFRILANLLAY